MPLSLNRPDLLRTQCPIGGVWTDKSHQVFTVTNPATQTAICDLPSFGQDTVEAAISSGKNAQRVWAKTTAEHRATILKRWHALVHDNIEDLAAIMTAEQGKPIDEARGEIIYAASFIEWFAEQARRIDGRIIPSPWPEKCLLTLRQPVGVVAAITPWNFPSAMVTRKVAPALAAGCSVIVKPASATPLSALALAVLAEEAGLPPSLFSVITGRASEIGTAMTQSPDVAKISFTGSTEIGAHLNAQAAPLIKRVSLELGGNAPFIVFEDADVELAVEGLITAKFRNTGQTCVCANRIYVHRNILKDFIRKASDAIESLVVGNGMEPSVTQGPLIDQAAFSKVQQHIDDAVMKGAKIETGGRPHNLGGLFFEPTLLSGATSEMKIAHEETFGPVAPIFSFHEEKDVLSAANDTPFGLAAYIFTRDLSRMWRVAEQLEVGMVGVNSGLISTTVAPFGGIKMSGLGREGSSEGIDEYLETKYIALHIDKEDE